MTVRTSAGTTLKVSASTPATFDATGYNALTMTTVGEVSDLGEFGREFNLVTFNPVGSRGVVKKKGSFNQGTMTIQMGLDTDDTGQILLKSASMSDADHSFLVTTQNGDKYYFQAQVMSFRGSKKESWKWLMLCSFTRQTEVIWIWPKKPSPTTKMPCIFFLNPKKTGLPRCFWLLLFQEWA